VANAKASTITYTESATVTGSLGGTSFPANEVLTLTGTGDTTKVTSPGSLQFFNSVTASFTLSVSVAGVGSGTFTDAIQVFQASNGAAPPGVGFNDSAAGGDILDTLNAAFGSYALSTSIGPITGSSVIVSGTSPTSVGALILTSAGNATFTAVVTPLPTALPLFATGLVGLVLLGWRRKRKAAHFNA
jgi:hypothetical protein